MYLENRQELLKVNTSNKNDVIKRLGQPHSKSLKEKNTWIYIERTKTKGKMYTLGKNVLVNNNNEGTLEWQDWIEDEDSDHASKFADKQELDSRRLLLKSALTTLNKRECEILTKRKLIDDPLTLEELSNEYNVSRERIRQIEVRAFEKIQKKMFELAQKIPA